MSTDQALEGLLSDLESACYGQNVQNGRNGDNGRALSNSISHLELPRRLGTSEVDSRILQDAQALSGSKVTSPGLDKAKSSPPQVPVRDLSSVMATTAMNSSRVANNLNELDVLLQDLSNAR